MVHAAGGGGIGFSSLKLHQNLHVVLSLRVMFFLGSRCFLWFFFWGGDWGGDGGEAYKNGVKGARENSESFRRNSPAGTEKRREDPFP